MESVSRARECQCCQECERKTTGEFKKVIELKSSGLSIYVHNDTNMMVEKKRSSVKQDEVFVVHNPSEKMIKRYDYISELSQFKTKCCQCKALIQRIRSAMREISDIHASEIRSLCQHCKRANPAGKCKRCEFIANKFFCNRVKQFEERQSKIEEWLCKVRALLQAILEKTIFCKHIVHQKALSIDEFDKLLKELDTPLPMQEPEIENTRIDRHHLMKETKDLLENYLTKLRAQNADRLYSSDESLYVSSSGVTSGCACKHIMDKKFDDKRFKSFATEESSGTKNEAALEVPKESSTERSGQTSTKKSLKKVVSTKDISSGTAPNKLSPKPSKKADDKNKQKRKSFSGEKKYQKKKENSDEALKNKILEHLKEKKQATKLGKRGKLDVENIKLPKIDDLPIIKTNEIEFKVSSESIVELNKKFRALGPIEMIKGIEIVPFDPHYKDVKKSPNDPMLFKTEPSQSHPTITVGTVDSHVDESEINTQKTSESVSKFGSGVLKYELSNRDFIDKGWTKLPTTKVMKRVSIFDAWELDFVSNNKKKYRLQDNRYLSILVNFLDKRPLHIQCIKMNIYKMIPANLKNNWFSRHSGEEIMLYNTGEKLATVNSSTRGTWYYKNGSIALDYYPAKELNAGQRVVIYSNMCREEGDVEKPIPVTVLASFDSLGNGVVYDHYGHTRLKYNQSEGIIIDDKVGPPGRWKWHMLNDPPVLQPAFINTYSKDRDPRIEELILIDKNNQKPGQPTSQKYEEANREMIAIELENFVKEKANKMLQHFKPFQIKMKALKINNHFSLKILDQANIYLLFSDGSNSMKLDLGMQLISTEIIDTDTAEVSQTETPYDKIPPRSRSIADIQDILKRARKLGKVKSVASKSTITSS